MVAHLAALAWGAGIEFSGWTCPLTWLEIGLRSAAGGAGYEGGFVEHYLLRVLYPAGLTREGQVMLGVAVLGFNAAVYGWLFWVRGLGGQKATLFTRGACQASCRLNGCVMPPTSRGDCRPFCQRDLPCASPG
jgi:hypothetical protein